MEHVFYTGQIIWAQVDANMHLRHSAYADLAAQARLNLLQQSGMSPATLLKMKIGPILFREETIYLKEVGLNDMVRVTCEMTRCRADGSRWSIRHEVYRSDDVKAATINVDGAWIDSVQRKLAVLPDELNKLFATAPRSDDFEEEIPRQKQ